MEHQQIIHRQPPRPAIAIREGVYILKFGVKVCRRGQRVPRLHIPQFLQQLPHLIRHILRRGSNLLATRHIIVLTGAFPQSPTFRAIGVFGQAELQLFEKRLIQRPPIPKGAQEQFIGILGVANLEQRPQIPGVAGDAIVFENLPWCRDR